MIHHLARIVAELRARMRTHFARSFRARQVVVFLPAALAAFVFGTFLVGLNKERSDWGRTSTVFVSKKTIKPDTQLNDGLVSRIKVPVQLVPRHALRALPNATTMRTIGEGEIVVAEDISPDASLPDDWVIIGVGAVDESLQLKPEDHVIALADGVVVCGEGRVSTARRSERSGETRVSVGVPASCAPALSQSIINSQVVLALVAAR